MVSIHQELPSKQAMSCALSLSYTISGFSLLVYHFTLSVTPYISTEKLYYFAKGTQHYAKCIYYYTRVNVDGGHRSGPRATEWLIRDHKVRETTAGCYSMAPTREEERVAHIDTQTLPPLSLLPSPLVPPPLQQDAIHRIQRERNRVTPPCWWIHHQYHHHQCHHH